MAPEDLENEARDVEDRSAREAEELRVAADQEREAEETARRARDLENEENG